MRVAKTLITGMLLGTLLVGTPLAAAPDTSAPERHVTGFIGVYSPNRLVEILGLQSGSVSLDSSSQITVIGVAQVLGTTGNYLKWELEAQLGQHSGQQHHQEMNAVLVARWTRFPWDNFIDTSFAFGEGLSWATQVPPLEPRSDKDKESTRLLNYLLVELEFSLPRQQTPWSAVTRVHHRSGVFGLFDGVDGGSNFVGLALRRRF